MIVGVPKEIKTNENRIALTPGGADMLTKHGHTVIVENNGGVGSGFSNEDYINAGATIIPTAAEVFAKADMIMKVKEPIKQEYDLIREKARQTVIAQYDVVSCLRQKLAWLSGLMNAARR